jgi:hypothetical protein
MGKTQAVKSKASSVNPKDLVGNTKVSLSKLPPIAIAHAAMAMMDGADKYGAFNWRDKDVIASIYVDAALRHLYCWFEGQERATDSKVHHLGHAIACCAILLDAQATGHLVDDRPLDRETTKETIDRVNKLSPEKRREWADDGHNNVIDPDWFEHLLGKLSDKIKAKKAAPLPKPRPPHLGYR